MEYGFRGNQNFFQKTKNILIDLLEDINLNLINEILIFGNRGSILHKTDFTNFNGEFTESFYFEKNFDKKFGMIVSFFDLNMIEDLNEFLIYILSHLEQDGVFIGCFIGELSLIKTRNKLWAIEEKTDGRFGARISPMIKLQDLNQLLYSFGFKNLITLKDDIVLAPMTLYDILHEIRLHGENSMLAKSENISKNLFKAIIQDEEKYNDNLEILSFCGTFSTKLFATQLKI